MGSQLDPRKSHHIAIFGRKGSGKSELARAFWRSYPGDRLVIDPTGDVKPLNDGEDTKGLHVLTSPLPGRWPGKLERERQTLYFRPDPGSATYEDDIDRAVGLAYGHGNCLLWCDEAGQVAPTNLRKRANARRVLQQGRHRNLTSLWCAPRPITLDPLVIAQADYVVVFQLRNPDDRKRCADTMGYEPAEFEEAYAMIREREHAHLWFDARVDELEVRPPIPLSSSRAADPHARFHTAEALG